MNMIEKVARNLYPQYEWGIQNGMKNVMHSTAKNGIKAMKEPTEEMLKASSNIIGGGFQNSRSDKEIYQSMIEAALKQ